MNTNLPVANRKRKVPALLGLVLLLFAGGIQQAPAVTPSNARHFDWKQGTIPNPCLDDGLPIKLTKGNGKFVGGAMGFGLIAFGDVDDDGTEEAITSGSCSYASSAQFVQVYSFPGTQPKLLTGWIPSAIYKEGVEALSFADGRIVIGWADAGIETFAWTGKGFAKVTNVSASKKANPKTTVVSFRKGTTEASLKARTVNGAARFELNFRAGQFLLLTTDNHFGAFPTVEFEDPNGNFIPLVAYHVWADEGFLQAAIKVPKSGPTRVTVRGLPQDKLYLFDFEAFNKPPAWFANYPASPGAGLEGA